MNNKKKIKIVWIKISDLKPSEYNPRAMTEKEKNDLKDSIQRFGMVEPIIVNEAPKRKNVIIGGHQRYYICQELGWKEMPVVYTNVPDIYKEKELNLRLNKNLGHWEYDMLANFDEAELLNVGFEKGDLIKIFHLEPEKIEGGEEETCECCGQKIRKKRKKK